MYSLHMFAPTYVALHIFMQMITLNLYLYAHIYLRLPYIYI